MEKVIVKVGPKGEITVEAQGVVGPGCAQLTKAIEQGLGRVTGDVKRPEFYQQQQQQQKAGR